MRTMNHIFVNKTTQSLASKYCNSLGGFNPPLRSQLQVNLTVNASTNNKICQYEYWTPIIKDKTQNKWVTVDKSGSRSNAEFLPWKQGSTDAPDQHCTVIDRSNKFKTEKCSLEHCFPCQFQQQVTVFHSLITQIRQVINVSPNFTECLMVVLEVLKF